MNEGIKLDRSFFSAEAGSYVTYLGDTYRVTQTIDLKQSLELMYEVAKQKVFL